MDGATAGAVAAAVAAADVHLQPGRMESMPIGYGVTLIVIAVFIAYLIEG